MERLEAFRDEMVAPAAGRVAAIMRAAAGPQSSAVEGRLLERLPEILAAYRALGDADQDRVRRLLATIVEGMLLDLRVFPGEDASKLAALETRDDLDRYTYLVAGCVGQFWTEVHVAHRPRLAHWDAAAMSQLGVRFGQGLQLTNVLRDVPRDLRQGRCYLPREDLARHGLEPEDLLDPASERGARPLLAELLAVALDRYEAGWQYTLAVPRREARLRLACAWPLLIGIRTLALLARTPGWLDPALTLKVSRARVYGLVLGSPITAWSTRALAAQARRWSARVVS